MRAAISAVATTSPVEWRRRLARAGTVPSGQAFASRTKSTNGQPVGGRDWSVRRSEAAPSTTALSGPA